MHLRIACCFAQTAAAHNIKRLKAIYSIEEALTQGRHATHQEESQT
jgi:hypothetical protein